MFPVAVSNLVNFLSLHLPPGSTMRLLIPIHRETFQSPTLAPPDDDEVVVDRRNQRVIIQEFMQNVSEMLQNIEPYDPTRMHLVIDCSEILWVVRSDDWMETLRDCMDRLSVSVGADGMQRLNDVTLINPIRFSDGDHRYDRRKLFFSGCTDTELVNDHWPFTDREYRMLQLPRVY